MPGSAFPDFRDADRDAANATNYLERLARRLAQQKSFSMDLLRLRPGQTVLEVGCGLGQDAIALAERVGTAGHVIAMDISSALIDQARERAAALGRRIDFMVGDCHSLILADASVDAAREDRALQHMVDPAAAVREMARVIKPGGRISLLEPDWSSVTVAAADRATTRLVVAHQCDLIVRQGTIGGQLRGLLHAAGCADIEVHPICVGFEDLASADRFLGLGHGAETLVTANGLDALVAAAWRDELTERDQTGTFYASITGFIAAATVP